MTADIVSVTIVGNEYKFNGLGLKNVRGKTLSDLEKAVKKGLAGKPKNMASAKQVIASYQTEVTQTDDGYVFNGLGVTGITEENLRCLEGSVERALVNTPNHDKIPFAKKAIADYKAIL